MQFSPVTLPWKASMAEEIQPDGWGAHTEPGVEGGNEENAFLWAKSSGAGGVQGRRKTQGLQRPSPYKGEGRKETRGPARREPSCAPQSLTGPGPPQGAAPGPAAPPGRAAQPRLRLGALPVAGAALLALAGLRAPWGSAGWGWGRHTRPWAGAWRWGSSCTPQVRRSRREGPPAAGPGLCLRGGGSERGWGRARALPWGGIRLFPVLCAALLSPRSSGVPRDMGRTGPEGRWHRWGPRWGAGSSRLHNAVP